MSGRKMETAFGVLWVTVLIGALSVFTGGVVVAIHFVNKWW